jgi:hypothetical protein
VTSTPACAHSLAAEAFPPAEDHGRRRSPAVRSPLPAKHLDSAWT